jgi:tRNA pseudouridine55 synthase
MVKRLLPKGGKGSKKVVKIGHTGTLDPMASGLLVVVLGRATRLSRYVTDLDKSYTATARLGASSDSLDADGEILELDSPAPTEDELRAVLPEFIGEIEQTPPMASAVKVDGERLYKAHRRGETVERELREAKIHSLELTGYDATQNTATFEVSCGSGTYVRTLISDLARAAESDAYLTSLRRTSVGSLSVAEAVAPDRVSAEDLGSRLLPMRNVVSHLPVLEVDEADRARVADGKSLSLPGDADLVDGEALRVEHRGELLAVYRSNEDSVRPEAVLCAG